MRAIRLRAFWRDRSGAAALEFTLALPLVVLMTLGVINIGVLLYARSALEFAAQDAARCYAVKKAACSDNAGTAAYALAHYVGPTAGAAFTRSASASCTNLVTGTLSYNFTTGLANMTIPVTATACYPV